MTLIPRIDYSELELVVSERLDIVEREYELFDSIRNGTLMHATTRAYVERQLESLLAVKHALTTLLVEARGLAHLS